MLDFQDEASAHEKTYTSFGQLPAHVDRERPPPRKAPFSTISHHAIVHTVRRLNFFVVSFRLTLLYTDLILPKDVYDAVWNSMRSKLEQPQYIQVILPLSALLEGEFFNAFIKTGTHLSTAMERSSTNVLRVCSYALRRPTRRGRCLLCARW